MSQGFNMRKGPIGSRMIVEFRKIGSVSIISFLVFLFTKKTFAESYCEESVDK